MKKFIAYLTFCRDDVEDVYDKESVIEAKNEKEALEKWLAMEELVLKVIEARRTDDKTLPGYASFAYARSLHFEVTMKEIEDQKAGVSA